MSTAIERHALYEALCNVVKAHKVTGDTDIAQLAITAFVAALADNNVPPSRLGMSICEGMAFFAALTADNGEHSVPVPTTFAMMIKTATEFHVAGTQRKRGPTIQ